MESHCFNKCNNSHKNVCAQKGPKGFIIGFVFEQRLRAYRKRPDPSRLYRVRIFFRSKKNSSAINHNWIKLKYLPRLPPGFGAFVGAEPTPIKQRIKLRTKFRRFYRRTWLLCTSFHIPISVNLTQFFSIKRFFLELLLKSV